MTKNNMTYEEFLKKHVRESEQLIRETPAYLLTKRQGEYTVEDYYNMPDDARVELIDGYIYYMEAASYVHQIIGMEIGFALMSYIEENNGECTVTVSPVDVQLDRDNKTMVQPDVMVVCDEEKKKYKGVWGAPEFVVEVLSPSTRKKDMTIKLQKYKNAGVKEYWIVDPKNKSVTVYDFAKDTTAIYGFESQIPVGIFDGKCRVDFARVSKKIEKFKKNSSLT